MYIYACLWKSQDSSSFRGASAISAAESSGLFGVVLIGVNPAFASIAAEGAEWHEPARCRRYNGESKEPT